MSKKIKQKDADQGTEVFRRVKDAAQLTEVFRRGQINSAETIRSLPLEPVYQNTLIDWLNTQHANETRSGIPEDVEEVELRDLLALQKTQLLRINNVTLKQANNRALKSGQLQPPPALSAADAKLLPLQLHLASASNVVENLYQTTHTKIATPLLAGMMLTQMQKAGQEFLFKVHDTQFKVVEVEHDKATFNSPFDPEWDGRLKSELVFTRLSDGEELRVPLGLGYTVAAYGYYGALSPQEIVSFFRLRFMTVHGQATP